MSLRWSGRPCGQFAARACPDTWIEDVSALTLSLLVHPHGFTDGLQICELSIALEVKIHSLAGAIGRPSDSGERHPDAIVEPDEYDHRLLGKYRKVELIKHRRDPA